MKIKEVNREGLVWKKINSLLSSPHGLKWKALFVIMLVLIVILASIYCGMALHKRGMAHLLNEIVQNKSKLGMIQNYFRGFIANPELITIDIKHMDYQKLAYKREIALAKGFLTSSEQDYVPATIKYKDKLPKQKSA